MASPIFRKHIYVNCFDHYPKGQSPLDFFNVDHAEFPLASQFEFIEVTLRAGDCMYVPAYFYIQSETKGEGAGGETIMIAEQYQSHSKFVDVLMDALEEENLTEHDDGEESRVD